MTSAFGFGTLCAVAILARDLDVAGDAGNRLQPVARHQAGVVAGAAGEDRAPASVVRSISSASTPNSCGTMATAPVTISSVSATAPGCSKISFCM